MRRTGDLTGMQRRSGHADLLPRPRNRDPHQRDQPSATNQYGACRDGEPKALDRRVVDSAGDRGPLARRVGAEAALGQWA